MRIIDWMAIPFILCGLLAIFNGRLVRLYDFRDKSKSRADLRYMFVRDRYSFLIGLVFFGMAIFLFCLK